MTYSLESVFLRSSLVNQPFPNKFLGILLYFVKSNFMVIAVQKLFIASLNILHFLEDTVCHLQ